MNLLYPVKLNTFYQLVEQLCWHAGVKNTNSWFSKKMYGNIRLAFLVCYKEKLNASYRRFIEICEENGIQRMLCIKRIPHFTTLQKFVQRTPKTLFETLVRACRKLLNLKDVTASIDGTGFSNTNPSQYYCKRVDGKTAKNYTKTLFLADNKTKLVLNIRTHSDNRNETIDFIPLVKEIKSALSCVLADKAYDSKANRRYCWDNNIEVHIPIREWKQHRQGYGLKPFLKSKYRKKAAKLFNKQKYNYRALVESVNSAIKRTLGSYVCSKRADNQQKQATIKAIALQPRTHSQNHKNMAIYKLSRISTPQQDCKIINSSYSYNFWFPHESKALCVGCCIALGSARSQCRNHKCNKLFLC